MRLQAYKTLECPKLEYAAAIWDPPQHFLVQVIEAMQNRADRLPLTFAHFFLFVQPQVRTIL